ncbi:MAG TPA: hypothetical protein VGK24_13365 [Candidatus Angelobacter sp.]|jgi:hypothetical protein
MWIILGFGWLGILFAGISLFRLADYADKKVRRLDKKVRHFASRPRHQLTSTSQGSDKQAA